MLIMHMAFLMRWYVSRCHSQEILLFARKETSLLAGMVQQRDEAFFVQTCFIDVGIECVYDVLEFILGTFPSKGGH